MPRDRKWRRAVALALPLAAGCQNNPPHLQPAEKMPTPTVGPAQGRGGGPRAGCQNIRPHVEPAEKMPTPTVASAKADGGVLRTDFQPKLDAEAQVGLHVDLARAHESRGRGEAAIAEYQQAIDAAEKSGNNLG